MAIQLNVFYGTDFFLFRFKTWLVGLTCSFCTCVGLKFEIRIKLEYGINFSSAYREKVRRDTLKWFEFCYRFLSLTTNYVWKLAHLVEQCLEKSFTVRKELMSFDGQRFIYKKGDRFEALMNVSSSAFETESLKLWCKPYLRFCFQIYS